MQEPLLREEFIVINAAGYPDPFKPWPNTREYAHEFAKGHRRLPHYGATVMRRLVSEWEADAEPNGPVESAPATSVTASASLPLTEPLSRKDDDA